MSFLTRSRYCMVAGKFNSQVFLALIISLRRRLGHSRWWPNVLGVDPNVPFAKGCFVDQFVCNGCVLSDVKITSEPLMWCEDLQAP
jgi:hypothetical protein